MASNQEIFGNDSSSSEEEDNNTTNNRNDTEMTTFTNDKETTADANDDASEQQDTNTINNNATTTMTKKQTSTTISTDDFDVESSDDDDDNNNNNDTHDKKNNKINENEDTTTTTTTTTTGTKDKEDTNANENNETRTKKTKDGAAPTKSDLFGDDDSDSSDDDGDVEFDEEGAGIVGTAAPEGAILQKKSQISTTLTAMDVDRSDDEHEPQGGTAPHPNNNEDSQTPQEIFKPLPPRYMKVLEAASPTTTTTSDNGKNKVSIHTTKLPNMLVGIQPEAFNEDTYSHLDEQELYSDVHNMIRWRYKKKSTNGNGDESSPYQRDQEGKLVRESNTRLVQWDDGSYTMHVGNQVFEVDTVQSKTSNGFAGINGYLYLSQKASYTDQDPEKNDDNDKEEPVVTPGGTVLECMGQVSSKFTVRPSSLQSDAHKNLTVAVRQRHMKQARIAEYVTQVDPEQAKNERIKVKEELDKANQRKNKQYAGHRGGPRTTSRPRMSRGYMEDDGNYDDVDIGEFKRRRHNEDDYDYGSDSEDDVIDDWEQQKMTRVGKRNTGGDSAGAAAAGKKKEGNDDDVFDMDDSSSDEEDEAINRHKAPVKKRVNLAVFDDDDDDDDDDE